MVVAAAVVVVDGFVVADAELLSAELVVCTGGLVVATAVVAAARLVVLEVSPAPEVSESELDNDIAPSPAKTMASAINTIASARNGGPPEVGFG